MKSEDNIYGENWITLRNEKGDPQELAEQKILSQYLHGIRKELGINEEVRKIVSEAKPAISSFPEIFPKLEHLIKPTTEDLFRSALEEVLIELEEYRDSGKPVLIDERTGKALFTITPDMMFTPPDYVGEDGITRKSKPILHPNISSTLGLLIQETAQNKEILRRSYQDPQAKLVYLHLTNPDSIIEQTSALLKKNGIATMNDIDGVDSEIIEFGKEQISGVLQSPNMKFHRVNLFASVLATKISKICGVNGFCSFGPLELKKNSKFRWYTIAVKMLPVN